MAASGLLSSGDKTGDLELEGGKESTNYLADSLSGMDRGFPRVKRRGELNLVFLSLQLLKCMPFTITFEITYLVFYLDIYLYFVSSIAFEAIHI